MEHIAAKQIFSLSAEADVRPVELYGNLKGYMYIKLHNIAILVAVSPIG